MRKYLYLILLLCISFITTPVWAQEITVYERNEANRYGIDESIDLNNTTIFHAEQIPYIDSQVYIYDFASLLTDDEVALIHNKLKNINDKYGIVIVTTNDVGILTTQQYADDFYDYNNFKKDGVLLLIDMQNREVYISTTYYGQILFDNNRVEDMLDEVAPQLTNRNYYDACNKFIDMITTYIEDGPSYEMKNCEITSEYGDYTCPKMLPIPIIIIGSFVFSILVTFIITRKYRKIKLAKNANHYLKNGEITLGDNVDQFLTTYTSKRYISSSSSGSGGGSSHRSSSGRSHSGGGRSF